MKGKEGSITQPVAQSEVVVGPARSMGMTLAAVTPPDDYPVPKDGQRGFAQAYTSSRDELERLRLLRRKERMEVEHRQYRTEVLGRVVIISGALAAGWAGAWELGRGVSGFTPYWIPTAVIWTLIVGVVGIVSGMALGRRHDATLLEIDKGADEMVDHHQERMMDYRRREEQIYRDRDERILDKQRADWDAILEAERLKLEREKLESEVELRRARIQSAQDIEEKKIEVEVQRAKDAAMLAQKKAEAQAAISRKRAEVAARKAELQAAKVRERAEALQLQRERLKLKTAQVQKKPGIKEKVEVTTAGGQTKVYEGVLKEAPKEKAAADKAPPSSGSGT